MFKCKRLCLVLASLMLLGSVSAASAQSFEDNGFQSFLDGRELVLDFSFAGEDEDVPSTSSRARIGCFDDGTRYSVVESISQDGEADVVMSMANDGTSLYVDAGTGEVIVLDFTKSDALLANMTAFVEYAAQNDAAVASAMAEMESAIAQMSSVNEFMASLEDATSFGELIDALLAPFGFVGVGDAFMEWAETGVEVSDFEGEIVSMLLDTAPVSARVYALTPESIGSLFASVGSVIASQEEALSNLLKTLNAQAYQGMSQEETDQTVSENVDILQSALSLPAEEFAAMLPQDMVLRLNECMDASGNTVCLMMEVYVPNGTESPIQLYGEILPDGSQMFCYADMGNGEPVTITLELMPTEMTTEESGEKTIHSAQIRYTVDSESNPQDFDVWLYLLQGLYEDAAEIYASVDITDNLTENYDTVSLSLYGSFEMLDDDTGISGYLSLRAENNDMTGYAAGGEIYGLISVGLNEDGTDFSCFDAIVETQIYDGDQYDTLMTFTAVGSLAEAQEPPFDPRDPDLVTVNPALMTEDEFIEWMLSLFTNTVEVITVEPESEPEPEPEPDVGTMLLEGTLEGLQGLLPDTEG